MRRLPPLLLLAFLSSCSYFTGEEDPNPVAELEDFRPTLKLRKAWSADLGGDDGENLRLALGPASDGARVYAAAHDGKVSAFDAERGKRIWRYKSDLPLSAGPATDGEVVLVGSSNGDVLALSAASGKKLWQVKLSSEVLAAPALAPGLGLVRTVDGKLAALGLADGKTRWLALQTMPRLTVRGTAAPVVAGNVVVAGFDNGKLAAYALTDGSVVWDVLLDPPAGRNEVERLADLNATVRVVGEDAYVAGYRGQVMSVALESGQKLWSQDARSYEGIAVDIQNVYVAGAGSELFALSRQNGVEQWRHERLKNRDISGPAAWQSSVVVGDLEGHVHVYAADSGASQARAKAGGGRVTSPPLVVNELLFVQTDGGALTAFRLQPLR
jgi:outer membrane protein assembly factor BamB